MADSQQQSAPDCSADGGEQQAQREGSQQQPHEVFGDVNLGAVMLFLMLLHLLNYSMRSPCTC